VEFYFFVAIYLISSVLKSVNLPTLLHLKLDNLSLLVTTTFVCELQSTFNLSKPDRTCIPQKLFIFLRLKKEACCEGNRKEKLQPTNSQFRYRYFSVSARLQKSGHKKRGRNLFLNSIEYL
jgi:hypothetical protein